MLRWPAAVMVFAACLLSILAPPVSAATEARLLQPGFWQFEKVEVTRTEPRKRPGPDAVWREVTLPESWRETFPGYFGQAWYRMSVDLPEVGRELQAIYVPNRRSLGLTFYVNGVLVGAEYQRSAAGDWYAPQFHIIPGSILRKGTNLIEIGMYGDALYRHGLGRVAFGNQGAARLMFRWQNNVENTYQSAQMVTLFVLGMLAMPLWLARRGDALIFWFMLGCLAWSIGFAVRVALLGIAGPAWSQTTAFMASSLTPLFTVVLCLRAGDRKFPLVEAGLWATFFGAIAWMHIDWSMPKPIYVWQNAYTALAVVTAVWLVHTQRRRLGWSLYVFVAAVALSVFFPIHDVLRDAGIIDLDRASLRHYQTIDLVIGIGAIVLQRYLAATKATETMNVELERRVAEKTVEIEDASRRVQAIREEQALAKERERILADMHDGVGASLVALTQVAQDDAIPRDDLARRAKDALQDLRMAIDSLEPYDGDLATVLGNMRERLGQSVQSAGVKLEWAVGDLPQMKSLTPSVVLDVQRIVYEAVTNAVRHAKASTITVAAEHAGEAIRIQVKDDGAGFDPDSLPAGRGLRSMRRRAERLHASFSVEAIGRGSVVKLDLPIAMPAEAVAPALSASPA